MKTMNGGKSFKSFCLLMLAVNWAVPGLSESGAKLKPLSDPALEAVLQQQIDPEEGVQLRSMVKSELEPGLPGEEQVVLWTLLGPSYWSNHLSVLSQQVGQWRLLATLSLDGTVATLETVTTDGLISMAAKTPGPNDPICCPSQQKTLHYRYGRGQLVEVKLEPAGDKP